MTYVTRMAIGGILLLGAGCGGGGGSGGFEIDLASDAAYDGFVTQGGGTANGFLLVGDENDNSGIRGVYRFSLAALPAGVTVVQAILNTYQFEVTGPPFPYPSLGNVLVDSIDLDAAPNPGLDATDYSSVAFSTVPGILSNSATLGQRSIDVTAAVQADVAGLRLFSDFRVYFANQTNSNLTGDQIKLVSALDSGGSGHFPRLTVSYVP